MKQQGNIDLKPSLEYYKKKYAYGVYFDKSLTTFTESDSKKKETRKKLKQNLKVWPLK